MKRPLVGSTGLPESSLLDFGLSSRMTRVRAKPDQRVLVLFGVTAAPLVGLFLLPSIPHDQHYHQFADQPACPAARISGTLFQIFLHCDRCYRAAAIS